MEFSRSKHLRIIYRIKLSHGKIHAVNYPFTSQVRSVWKEMKRRKIIYSISYDTFHTNTSLHRFPQSDTSMLKFTAQPRTEMCTLQCAAHVCCIQHSKLDCVAEVTQCTSQVMIRQVVWIFCSCLKLFAKDWQFF
jgi:hypothetical protein